MSKSAAASLAPTFMVVTTAIALTLSACATEKVVIKEVIKEVPAEEGPHEDTLLEIARQNHDYAKWSYGGEDGPKAWGGLDSHYAVCEGGPFQSPIDIQAAGAEKHHTDLHIKYKPAELHALNNGHTVQLDAEADNDQLEVNGHDYKLIQMHFHSPSEHHIGGETFPMEAHFVHIDEYDHLAVLGVPIRVGAENAILKPLFENLPAHGGEKVDRPSEKIDLPNLLPDEQHFFHYLGSLTTPPCTENVLWFVLETPIEVSQAQLDAFLAVVHENSRPVQATNNRVLIRNEVIAPAK